MTSSAVAIKTLELALHPGTGENEAKAAALGFLRIARSNSWGLAELRVALGGGSSQRQAPPPKQPRPKPWGWSVVMRFGKHKGVTLGHIAETDPSYLSWLLTIDIDAYLSAAVEAVLTHLREGYY